MATASRRRNGGFTIIELMVVVVTLGALLLIAFPAYRDYLVRASRAEAQSVLLEIHSRQEQYAATNRAYAITPAVNNLATLGITVPTTVQANYDIVVAASCLTLVAASGGCTATCSVPGGTGVCDCTCTCASGCPRAITGFTATATPKAGGSQAADVTLGINQYGLRTPVGVW